MKFENDYESHTSVPFKGLKILFQVQSKDILSEIFDRMQLKKWLIWVTSSSLLQAETVWHFNVLTKSFLLSLWISPHAVAKITHKVAN